jgi:hypothetical protein
MSFELTARCFSHGVRSDVNLSKASSWPVRDCTHSWPSGRINGMPVNRLIAPSSFPAKWSGTEEEAVGCTRLAGLGVKSRLGFTEPKCDCCGCEGTIADKLVADQRRKVDKTNQAHGEASPSEASLSLQSAPRGEIPGSWRS